MAGTTPTTQSGTANGPAVMRNHECSMFTFVQHDGAVKRRKLV